MDGKQCAGSVLGLANQIKGYLIRRQALRYAGEDSELCSGVVS